MIKRLVLRRFGKFAGAEFDFGGVTVFVGDNEAGKTTIFDALADCICRPGGNVSYGKELKARYGAERSAEAEFEGEPPSIDCGDFLNLFAIRAGILAFSIPQGSAWTDKIKSSLFTDGIDPGLVAQLLEKDAATRANSPYGKEKKRLADELARLEGELAEAETARDRCLREETKVAALEGEHSRAKADREELKAEAAAIETRLAAQGQVREFFQAREAAALLAELAAARERLERTRSFAEDRSEELTLLERKAAECEIARAKAEALLESARRDAGTLAAERDRLVRESAEFERIASVATSLKIALGTRDTAKRRAVRWNLPLVVLSMIIFAAGSAVSLAALFLGFLPLPAALIAAGASVLVALTLFLLSRRAAEAEDETALRDRAARVREEWASRTGRRIEAAEFDGVLRELERVIEAADAARDRSAAAAAALAAKEAEARKCETEAVKARDSSDAARRVKDEFLRGFGSASRDDYVSAVRDRRALVARVAAMEKDIARTAASFGLAEGAAGLRSGVSTEGTVRPEGGAGSGDVAGSGGNARLEAALSAECDRRIASLQREISSASLPEAELRVLENSLRIKRESLERLESKEKESYGDFKESLAAARTAFRDLPERITRLEEEIGNRNIALAELEIGLKAASMARDLFAKISADSLVMFDELSREIGATYSGILDAPSSVRFEAFSADGAIAADALGSERNDLLLSSGTRDAFHLASRLTLAAKTGLRDAPLVLDEPFLALDRQRAANSLRVLRQFREQTGWQIVIFTKEPEIADLAKKTFPDALVHTLQR